MVNKPTISNYQGLAPVPPRTPARRGVRVSSDAPQKISEALYYELMVSYHSLSDAQLSRWSDKVYQELEDHFGTYIDSQAAANPKRLHHVYEWGQAGNTNKRLWRLKKRKGKAGAFRVTYGFILSKTKAPIDPVLKVPGPSGKVVTKTYAFKNKAYVMEYGIPVTIRPKTGRWLAFRADNMPRNIGFSNRERRVNYPGGIATKYAFSRSFAGFFRSGLAQKYLKPTFQKPVRVMKRAGENIPVTISNAKFSRGLSQSAVEEMARWRVEQESRGLY